MRAVLNKNRINWICDYENEPSFPAFLYTAEEILSAPDVTLDKDNISSIDGEISGYYKGGQFKMIYDAQTKISPLECTESNVGDILILVNSALERIKKEKIKLKYIGETFGALSLTSGKIYEALDEGDFYRVIDDSGEDYLYSKVNPRPTDGSSPGGRWEIVEE